MSIDTNILCIKGRPFKNRAIFSPQNSSCLSSYRNSKKGEVRLSPLYDSTFYRTTTRDDASSSRRFIQTNETVHSTARIQRVTGNKYRRNERTKKISAIIDGLKLFHARFQTNSQKGSMAPLRNKTHRLTIKSMLLRVSICECVAWFIYVWRSYEKNTVKFDLSIWIIDFLILISRD